MTDRLPTASIPPTAPIDPRSLAVDTTPLSRTNPWDGEGRTVELSFPTSECMVFAPRRRWFLRHAFIIVGVCLAPLVTVIGLLVNEIQDDGSWGGILIAAFGTLLFLGFVCLVITAPAASHRRIQFDRRTGVMTMSRRPFGPWRSVEVVQSRPLRDIVAIQLLYGGEQCTTIDVGHESGGPGSVTYWNYPSYQLNLVLADTEQPRYNLTTHSDSKRMREAGQKVAGFLDIPFLDQDSTAGHDR